jgi:hypothetical protein
MIDSALKSIIGIANYLDTLLYFFIGTKLVLFAFSSLKSRQSYSHLLYYSHASRIISRTRKVKEVQNLLSIAVVLDLIFMLFSSLLHTIG